MLLKMFRYMVGEMNIYTNIYVVTDEHTKEGIIIDPGGAIDKVYNYIENLQIKPKFIVFTHCHADHIAGLKMLKGYYPNARVIIHEYDREGLTSAEISQCESVGVPQNYIEADITVKDGDIIQFGNMLAKVMHTPGHTKGGMSLFINDAVFTGDTMFKRLSGRTDLPTGNEQELELSIEKLLKLPETTIVYPGHGAMSIIREEKEYRLG